MDRKQEIIEAAKEIIKTQGVKGFTASNVAELVGIKKATLFYHFPNMKELLLATFESMINRFSKVMEGIKCDSPEEFFENFGRKIILFYDANKDFMRGFMSFTEKILFDDDYTKRLIPLFDGIVDFIYTQLLSMYPTYDERWLKTFARLLAMHLDSFRIHVLLWGRDSAMELWNAAAEIYLERLKSYGGNK